MSVRPGSAKPSPEALAAIDLRWRARHLQLAPHRLAFCLAMLLLAASGAWWAWVQGSRLSGAPLVPAFVPVSLVHAALMVFGFFPLFFSGFLFTAGPRWLQVEPWPVARLRIPLWLQAGGWLVWLVAVHGSQRMAFAGVVLALVGMVWVTALFWRLVLRSKAEDQMHTRTVGAAFGLGTLCVAGLAGSVALGAWDVARLFVLSGLWAFVVVVFVTVAHRMLPFFSPPGPNEGHLLGALALLAGAAVFEGLGVWIDAALVPANVGWATAWTALHGLLELALGGLLLWRAWGWAKRQHMRNRLLRMFYIGFVWLGLAYVLHGLARAAQLAGVPALELGALHALTLGCLASLMLAMVTRVSCGNSGRAQVVDRVLWAVFVLLQLAAVLRVGAALAGHAAPVLLALAALLWTGLTLTWALRLGSWYGRLRPDGRAG
ncbi:MAG: NnrS family protein [Giesbergeria sp.]